MSHFFSVTQLSSPFKGTCLKLVQGTGNFPTDEHAYNFKLATQKREKNVCSCFVFYVTLKRDSSPN